MLAICQEASDNGLQDSDIQFEISPAVSRLALIISNHKEAYANLRIKSSCARWTIGRMSSHARNNFQLAHLMMALYYRHRMCGIVLPFYFLFNNNDDEQARLSFSLLFMAHVTTGLWNKRNFERKPIIVNSVTNISMTDRFLFVLFSLHSRPIRRAVISSGSSSLKMLAVDTFFFSFNIHKLIVEYFCVHLHDMFQLKSKNVVDWLLISLGKFSTQLEQSTFETCQVNEHDAAVAVLSCYKTSGEGFFIRVCRSYGTNHLSRQVFHKKKNHNNYDSNNLSVRKEKARIRRLGDLHRQPLFTPTKHD